MRFMTRADQQAGFVATRKERHLLVIAFVCCHDLHVRIKGNVNKRAGKEDKMRRRKMADHNNAIISIQN